MAPERFPGCHVYVVAPEADSVALPPAQTEGDDELTIRAGEALTVTLRKTDEVQPEALVPVTV